MARLISLRDKSLNTRDPMAEDGYILAREVPGADEDERTPTRWGVLTADGDMFDIPLAQARLLDDQAENERYRRAARVVGPRAALEQLRERAADAAALAALRGHGVGLRARRTAKTKAHLRGRSTPRRRRVRVRRAARVARAGPADGDPAPPPPRPPWHRAAWRLDRRELLAPSHLVRLAAGPRRDAVRHRAKPYVAAPGPQRGTR